ncbi:hypothetical protein NYS50_07165 [Curtobacterium flaccumfaciens pv. flaccumfaciens]|uniref:hypothetical protein n=1 Tax=Curtobacterium flaccumfaciens TaxID=2035 RepID=UPI00217E3304|nr:hypothetical protein [Curtobacterium flaccumfaciens]MCS6547649.1 hypothetical protein [Curtobacterium flaccumfaciens pv. flaccumfaciens]
MEPLPVWVFGVHPEDERFEYRARFNKEAGQSVLVAMEQLSGLRRAASVGCGLEARRVSRWKPFDASFVPGMDRLRQLDSSTVHAGVLIDGWRLDSAGETYSTFCGPKTGANRLVETTDALTCKRCIALNRSSEKPTYVRTLFSWHAKEIERLVRQSAL